MLSTLQYAASFLKKDKNYGNGFNPCENHSSYTVNCNINVQQTNVIKKWNLRW